MTEQPLHSKVIDTWTRMYEEQIRHVRHHETLRTQSTSIFVTASVALLAYMGTTAAEGHRPALAALLIAMNLYGALTSVKHFERSKLHATVAARYRADLSRMTAFGTESIEASRELARAAHDGQFKFLEPVRVHVLWLGLHLIVVVIGLYIAFAGVRPN